MVFDEVFENFIEESPVSVMFRGTMENIFAAEKLDTLFRRTSVWQREGELLFSTCAEMLALVVVGSRKSVNAAYRAKLKREEVAVSVNSVYNKLAGIEPSVSESLVRESSTQLSKVIESIGSQAVGPLPGYDVRIFDGNHLAGTEHRLEELRRLGAAALPGKAIAVLNPQTKLIEDVVLSEYGHANERSLLPALVERINRGQLWIGDANFCTIDFLFGVVERDGLFLIRQHGSLHGELVGSRKKIGRISTGVVCEQMLRIKSKTASMEVRRITIKLDQPTEKGKTEIHLLTNVSKRVNAKRLALAYRDRWTIETAFQMLATTLRSEINTLGYPDAALFGFCLALVLHNMISTIKSAISKSKRWTTRTKKKLSDYYLADEISGVCRGMAIAIPGHYWKEAFGSLSAKELAKRLLWLAKHVDEREFLTNPWRPKPPPTKRVSGNRGNHVATQELLDARF